MSEHSVMRLRLSVVDGLDVLFGMGNFVPPPRTPLLDTRYDLHMLYICTTIPRCSKRKIHCVYMDTSKTEREEMTFNLPITNVKLHQNMAINPALPTTSLHF